MVSWILIALVVIGVLVYVKFTAFKYTRTWSWFLGILIVFFVLSFGYVIIKTGDVNNIDDFSGLVKTYFSWLTTFFANVGELTGNVVNADWSGNFTK